MSYPYAEPRHNERDRLGDAWAGCLVEVDDAIFWMTIARCRGETPHPRYAAKYLEHVRMVSEYEQRMDAMGVEYVREAA